MKPEIVVEIDESGEKVSIEVKGEQGRKCVEATQFLEEALGTLQARTFKTEYFLNGGRVKARQDTVRRQDSE